MKVSVFIATSLDGFIARKDGSLDWLPQPDGKEDYGYAAFMETVDVLIMGRRTYETVLSFGEWPYGRKKVIVLTRDPAQGKAASDARIEVMSGEPAAITQKLSSRGFNHAYVDGGRAIQGFLAAGLVNRMIITRIPVLLGEGIPLFRKISHDIVLRHVETRAFDNGLVQSTYEIIQWP